MSRRPGLVVAVAMGLLAAACGGEPNALDPHGSGARQIAPLWWVMLGLGTAVFVLVLGLLLGTVRRRQSDTSDAAHDERTGHRWILLGGVVLPVVVVVPISLLTLVIGNRLYGPADDDAVEVELVGHQFWWEVRYPESGAVTANELHLPVDRDVRVTMRSEDVVHSFWVPSLHGKVDLIPGEETELVLDADRPGRYEALCAEFCGIQHTHMRMLVVAHPEDEYDAWLEREASDAPPPSTTRSELGAEVFDRNGCASCHTVRGTDADGDVGPDLTHVGSRLTLGANTIENNRGNLAGWIADPQRIKPGNHMPPSVLDAEELLALVAYLEGLE